MPRGRRWPLAGAISALSLLVVPALPWADAAVVRAHAQLVASSPGAGSVVAEPPEELRLVFSEPLEEQVTSLDIVAADGTAVLSGAGTVDPSDEYALVVAAPDLADGIYEVRWRTLSAADGHSAEGSFTFGVGAIEGSLPGGSAGAMTHTEADANRVAGRWLTYPGLLLAVGVPAFFAVVVRRGPIPRGVRRGLAIVLGASALATTVLAVTAAVEAGSVTDYLLGTRNGGLQLARAVITAAGAAAVLLAPPRLAGAAAATTGLVGIGLLVVAGHAAAQPGWVTPLVGVVHVGAAAVWFAGVAGLLAMLVRPDLVAAGITLRESVPRFSALALVSIGLVAVTGVYSAWAQNGALLRMDTQYGVLLVLKSALAVGALALGGLNFLDVGRVRAWLGGISIRLKAEVALIGAVLVVSAVLALTSPDAEARVAIEPIPDAFGEIAPGMSLELAPGRPGVNRVVVATTDALATGSVQLELVLDRLDTGTSTRVPLMGEGMAGMDHTGMDHTGMDMGGADGETLWMADAVVLPPGSAWDTNVVIVSEGGAELSRQRFAFTVDAAGVDEGRASSLLELPNGVALALLVGGALGLGMGLGGVTLPRTEAVASRVALVAGGSLALVVGLAIGATRLLG